jgi:hypothetical protein
MTKKFIGGLKGGQMYENFRSSKIGRKSDIVPRENSSFLIIEHIQEKKENSSLHIFKAYFKKKVSIEIVVSSVCPSVSYFSVAIPPRELKFST